VLVWFADIEQQNAKYQVLAIVYLDLPAISIVEHVFMAKNHIAHAPCHVTWA